MESDKTELESKTLSIDDQIKKQYSCQKFQNTYGEFFDKLFAPGKNFIDLANGYPDMELPNLVTESVNSVLHNQLDHQYGRPMGVVNMVQEAAEFYQPMFKRTLDPFSEILVTPGATGGFFNLIEMYLHAGDEIVGFEPFYTFFRPPLRQKGINIKYIPLLKYDPDDDGIGFEKEAFEAAFSSKTKMFFFNNLHNPTGKVFTREELEYMAEFLRTKYPNLLVVADEVYHPLVYSPKEHICFASLPGMWERTITLFSFGKIFLVTAWRIGFAIGPKNLIWAMYNSQYFYLICMPTLLLEAGAKMMRRARTEPYQGEANYLVWLQKQFESKYHEISDILNKSKLNLKLLKMDGGFFFLAKINKAIEGMPIKYFYRDERKRNQMKDKDAVLEKFDDWVKIDDPDYSPDFAYCYYLAETTRIFLFPVSGFFDTMFDEPSKKRCVNYVRGTTGKSDASIQEVKRALGVD